MTTRSPLADAVVPLKRTLSLTAGLALTLGGAVSIGLSSARADIVPTGGARSLGTSVSCSGGACGVDGGFSAGGKNLYHRFDAFDTRSGITGVQFRNGSHGSVIVGVLAREGTFITAPVGLQNPASLMWLSPGGISISGNGGFQNVTQLGLTTQTGLRMGASWFDVYNTTAQNLAASADYQADLTLGRSSLETDLGTLVEMGVGNSPGSITINPAPGVELSVNQNLLIDSGVANLSVTGASLRAGTAASPRGSTSVALLGNDVAVQGARIEAAADGIVNLQSDGALSVAGTSELRGLKIGLRGATIDVTDSRLTAPRGLIQATAQSALTVSTSTLDVAPRVEADVTSPALGFDVNAGATVISSEPAFISLTTTEPGGSISLSGSSFDASSLVAAIPGSETSTQDLIAGNIFVSSAGSVAVQNSGFRADADTNYAGQISLLSRDPAGTLQLSRTDISASAPNGSGDISLYAEGPIVIQGASTLEASTLGVDFAEPTFRFNPSSEIRVTSRSAQGILIEDSTLRSGYELTAPSSFSNYQERFDTADNDSVFDPQGGLVRLTSAGAVELRASTLDASSASGVGGRVEISSAGGSGVSLLGSSLLATVGGPLPAAIEAFFGVPPEQLEGLQAGRIDVVSSNGISAENAVLDASNTNLSVRFDLGIGDFVPLTGEINLIAGGQDGSGISLRNSELRASSPSDTGFFVDSQGGSIQLALAGGSGGITRENVSIDVSPGDPAANLVEQLPTNTALASYQTKSGQTLQAVQESELGSGSSTPRTLQQLATFESSLLNNEVAVVIDARDPVNVVVTVIDQSLAPTVQANTSTAQSFDTTTLAGQQALEGLLTDLTSNNVAIREAVLPGSPSDSRAAEQASATKSGDSDRGVRQASALAPPPDDDVALISQEAVREAFATEVVLSNPALPGQLADNAEVALQNSFSGDSAATLDRGSGADEGAPSSEVAVATAEITPSGVASRATTLPAALASATLSSGEARSAQDMARFLGLEGAVPAVPTLAQLQQQLGAARQQGLPSPALLRLSYAEAPDQADAGGGGALDVVLVTPDGAPQGWRSPIALPRMRELLRAYYTALAEQRSGVGEAGSPERILFDLVLRPALPSLEQADIGSLIISADPSLIDIPFSALHDGQQYLGERFSLAVTPSLAFTNLAAASAGHAAGSGRRMQAGASTFINGLTPLPMVEQELSRLADQQEGKATTLLNQQFTPVTFAQAFADPGTRQVHIASHAEIAAGKEKAPRIYTSQEVIGMRELGRLRQRSSADALDLVTLSACRSALNAADLELGFAGLAVQMGARSAIGTKWYVDDTAMSSFFVMFYDQLQRGSTKAEALRATQRAFARGEVRVEGSRVIGPGGATLLANLPESYQHRYGRGFSHPYYWAGVQLVGSPW